MSEKDSSPSHLDVVHLAKAGSTVGGELLLPALPRLAGCVDALEGAVHWSAQGLFRELPGREPEVRLQLRAQAQVTLVCQRCLEAMHEPVRVNRDFRFVRDPKQAELLDEASEDEDVLALPKQLNLVELIEDELIMTLPIVPRHGQCPAAPAMAYDDGETPVEGDDSSTQQQPHPFAGLAALRRGKPQS